jgi:hypothetical protein
MMQELNERGWRSLPVWVPLSVVLRFTGLRDDDVSALKQAGRLRTLNVGRTGKRVRYHRDDLGKLCGFTH